MSTGLIAAIVASLVLAVASLGWSSGAAEFVLSAPAAPAEIEFSCPTAPPYRFTDTFGAPRPNERTHRGIDIFGDQGTPITAIVSGTVTKAVSTDDGTLGGIRVWVDGDDGWWYYYAHLDSVAVEVGERVDTGQQLGTLGKSGNAANTPPHVHVEQHFGAMDGPFVNPYALISAVCTENTPAS